MRHLLRASLLTLHSSLFMQPRALRRRGGVAAGRLARQGYEHLGADEPAAVALDPLRGIAAAHHLLPSNVAEAGGPGAGLEGERPALADLDAPRHAHIHEPAAGRTVCHDPLAICRAAGDERTEA